jgi:hypothetical protein
MAPVPEFPQITTRTEILRRPSVDLVTVTMTVAGRCVYTTTEAVRQGDGSASRLLDRIEAERGGIIEAWTLL